MSDKSLETQSEEVDYASQFCVEREEDLVIPHAELPPFRKFICVVEILIFFGLIYIAGSILFGHIAHLWHKFHIMYAVPWEFFLHLLLPFGK